LRLQTTSIRRLETTRPDLFAFEVAGRIHAPDIEAMAGIISRAFDTLGEIDIIIVIREWQGIDLGAALDQQALSVQARANSHVRRYAVVGAPGWAEAMIGLFAPLTPVEEKTFDLAEEAKAWAWIGESRSAAAQA
jgi:hypothetical protein